MAAMNLKRTKAAPLEIQVFMTQAKNSPTLPNVLIPHFRITKTLTVRSISSYEEFTRMFPIFPQSMPNLRPLTLESENIEGWNSLTDWFDSLTHTLEGLELLDIPPSPTFLACGSLTSFILHHRQFGLPLDILVDLLERNHALTSADLRTEFVEPSLRSSQRRSLVRNQLQCLHIYRGNVVCSGRPSPHLQHTPMERREPRGSLPLR